MSSSTKSPTDERLSFLPGRDGESTTSSLYKNCYCEAKNCPVPMKLHPGNFFGTRNPKIKVRDRENEEK